MNSGRCCPILWEGDGIIARIGSRTQLDQIRSRREPKVNVDTVFEGLDGIYDVITDDAQRADLALAHLRDRGFEEFAYFAPPSLKYSNQRGQAFIDAVTKAGYQCREYKPGYRVGRKIGWEEQQRRVSRWLKSLPSRVAVFTVDAHRGRQLAEICYLSGIRVPDQVAILAGDTDELMCGVSTPPLSSIALAGRRIGYEAAALLDRLMQGERPTQKSYKIAPQGVISRQSTDILSIDDESVVRALRFIQSHAFQDIVVKDILNEVPISRRSLEIQFQHYLGRSPAEEIRRVRLEKGKELLARSDFSIGEIAVACGFANTTRFRRGLPQTLRPDSSRLSKAARADELVERWYLLVCDHVGERLPLAYQVHFFAIDEHFGSQRLRIVIAAHDRAIRPGATDH